MDEENEKLLSYFEFKLEELLKLNEGLKEQVKSLNQLLAEKDETISTLQDNYEQLNTCYVNLKQAMIIGYKDTDLRQTKLRISKLVREIDKCIALLNN